MFLLAKSTHEIRDELEGGSGRRETRAAASVAGVIAQIMILDIIFSLDSVITAIGMANRLEIMVLAAVLAVLFMMSSAGRSPASWRGTPRSRCLP